MAALLAVVLVVVWSSRWFGLLLMSVVLVVLVNRPHPDAGIGHGGACGDSGGIFGVFFVDSYVSCARLV